MRLAMTSEQAIETVRAYYRAYRADSEAAILSSLRGLVDPNFVLESPLVEERFGGGLKGDSALSAAVAAAPFLKNADVESLYTSPSGDGAASLISFPTPAGTIVQSEHFDLDQHTGRITRLRSYYDPRKLLPSG